MTEHNLPPLNALHARSTYAMLLTLIVPLASLFGIDLLGLLGSIPAPAEIGPAADRLTAIATIATATWAYAERRRPKFAIDWGAAARSVASTVVRSGAPR